MSKFILKDVSEEHHKQCQDECGKTSGTMLKCMNLAAIGKMPCKTVIHAECAGYDLSVLPHMTSFYCTDCTTSNSQLHQAMSEIETKAKKAVEAAQTSTNVSKEEHEALKKVTERLDAQLREKVKLVSQQAAENKRLAEEMQQLKEAVRRMEAERSSSSTRGQFQSTFFERFNDTLRLAEGVDENIRSHRRTVPDVHSSSIYNSSFNANNSVNGWPDYDEQQRQADQLGADHLFHVRATVAKPTPFEGDVTKWSTFLSEFVRTSARGHFRDYEDMDRLRELIVGKAKQMFHPELADPCAEALPTLKLLDEFYGVHGNAVGVALDRITQLPRIDKASDEQKLTNLYTQAKQFALQCHIQNQDYELASKGNIFIIESKMFVDHVKAWRVWVKNNNKAEDVRGIIAYLQEIIRELSYKNPRSKPIVTASVNQTEVTGGLNDGGTETAPTPSTSYAKSHEKSKGKSKSKKKNRYANCPCFQCQEKHPFYKCPQLIAASDSKRVEIVNKLHVCTRCLASNKHKQEDCPNRCLRCYITGCTIKNRHPLLHGHPNDQIPAFTATNAHIDVGFLQAASHFAVVPGHVISLDGTQIPITVMFDGGSGISLATSQLFDQAKCESHMEYALTLRWATDITHTDHGAKLFDIKFLPLGRRKAITLRNVSAVQDLKLPEQGQNAEAFRRLYPHLEHVPLPSYPRQAPQILLGLSHVGLMNHLTSISSGKAGDPVAALTPLGWVVYGNCHESLRCQAVAEPTVVGFTCDGSNYTEITNEELLKCIRSCNDVESLGVAHKNASLLSADDQQAERIISSTMKFKPEIGRYEIGLFWRNRDDRMPDNYDEAVQRLIATEKRLQKLNMLNYVHEQFQEQLVKGWLVETTREEANKFPRRNYVYGFLTFNKNKSPPKPRWVNDTAATYKGVSLNSKLLKGPDNLVPLPQSMCALREGQIAFQGDVKSMFNQVMLKEEDQYSQLTLWRDGDTLIPPRIYRQTRVIFGPTCSPSATSSIRIDHAKRSMEEFPEAADVAINQMYVDDAPDSRDTIEQAAKVANDLITMFARIGWPLVEFQSNSQEFLQKLPANHISTKMVDFEAEDEDFITKVLGIFWMPQLDVYVYRLNDDSIIKKCTQQNYQPTKKEMLSTVMRIFDPLGQIAPFRIRGHMIMQHVWRAGTDWKRRPPKEICEEFSRWLNDFEKVARLKIPRAYFNLPLKDCELSLHVFVDAGAEAYAACAYIRIQHEDQVQVRLIAAKAKVAPLKYMSIPRLELMSGLIGARLLKAVMQWHRRLKFVDYICWTDSDVSFKWIRSHHLPRTAFSAPRIAEIQELTSADKWRYVPSKLNVADYATKVRPMDYSDPGHEWYIGPKFLYETPDKWPAQPEWRETEKYETRVTVTSIENDKSEGGNSILSHVSPKIRGDWSTFTRVVAKALRFADYLLPQQPYHRRVGHFTNYEIERAENYIIRLVQQAAFPEEYGSLLRDNKIKKASPLHSLSPIMCPQTRLLRATTRLSNSFPLNMRSPPILPNFHEVTDAIVQHYHKINLHVGDSAITAQLRSRVWIINAKRAVRRCRARCLHCIERRTKPPAPNRADLPDFRLDINEKPFFHTGCDLFGPFTVYTGRSKHKKEIHVVIFTCMVTRAIYLEVLDDKSTENFLVAFDKLWARRGPIAHIYSDNGLNFVGAAKVIKADELQKATADRRITWHFNPPYTPQFGGAWERLIKDIKRGLEASIGKFVVPRLSMEAALARIEANLNNRPLTEIPVSSEDDIPLSPQLLMTGYPNYPCLDESSNTEMSHPPDIMSLKTARRVNSLIQAFRHRFIAEYAPIITRRPLNTAKAKYLLKLNDYVIYMDPTKNPSDWPRGIICKTYPGKDSAVRVVDIKLKGGNKLERRPSHLIAKLDIRFDDIEAENNKYMRNCNLLVKRDLNLLTSAEQLSNSANKNNNLKVIAKVSIKSVIMAENKLKIKISNGTTVAYGPKIQRSTRVRLTDEEKDEYIDKTGEKLVFAKNFPPTLCAADVFTIMSGFGEVKLIACSTWNGKDPFKCIVGYSDPASVSTALMCSESQTIVINGKAFTTIFEKMKKKPVDLSKSVHSPTYAFLDMGLPNQQPRRMLFVTLGRGLDVSKRAPMPPTSDGRNFYVVDCCHKMRFDFTIKEINARNEKEIEGQMHILTRVYKDAFIHEAVLPCAGNSSSTNGPQAHCSLRDVLATSANTTADTASEDTLEGPNDYSSSSVPDLRALINKKKELKQIKSVIFAPKGPSKSRK